MATEPISVPIAGGDYERRLLSWCQEALQEGEAVLKGDRSYSRIQDSIDYVMGDYNRDLRPSSLSSISENRWGKVHEDLKSALTDIRPFWEYRTFNDKFKRQAAMLGKLSVSLWL